MDYDPRIESLIHPERRETVFRDGESYDLRQIGAGMAHLAYYGHADAALARLNQALGRAGFDAAHPVDQSLDTQAFTARRRDGLTVLAFRGTQPNSIEDI